MRSGRVWIAALIALATAAGSYVAFQDGPDIVLRILHPPQPDTHKRFVPPPVPPPPTPYVTSPEAPETSVAPITPATIPGITLPPARKSK